MPIRKVSTFLRKFSRNSQMLNSMKCRPLIPNFTQISLSIIVQNTQQISIYIPNVK